MWNYYDLTMTVDTLVGGTPKHPEIVQRWQEARWPKNPARVLQPGDPQTPAEAADVTVELLGDQAIGDDEVQGIWTGFVTTDDGELAVEARQVKAMFKESANILRTMLKVGGKVIPLRAKLAERLFVAPKLIGLGVREPSDTTERPIHVMTARGPRTALKRTDLVRDAKVAVELRVLDDGIITEHILRSILEHAAVNGFGTDRSQGNGTFQWELARRP